MTVAGSAAAALASDQIDPVTYAGVSLLIAVIISVYGYAKKSLNTSGAVAAIFVGFITFFSGYVYGLVLIAFFLSSSRITKVKSGKLPLFFYASALLSPPVTDRVCMCVCE